MRLRLDSWYQNLSQRERVARMYAPQVTPRAGRRLHDRRRERPQPARSGDQPLRRRRTRPNLSPSPQARQTTDHPPRLQHRRRRTSRPSLRLGPTHDRGLHHHPQRDERIQRSTPKPGHKRHRQQRHQRVHVRPQTRQLHPPVTSRSRVPPAPQPSGGGRLRPPPQYAKARGFREWRDPCWQFATPRQRSRTPPRRSPNARRLHY